MAEMTIEQKRALAMASARLRMQQQPIPAQPAPQQPESALMRYGVRPIRDVAGTIVEPALQMGLGLAGSVAGDIAGLGAIPLHAAGVDIPSPEEVQRSVSGAISYEPRTAGGRFVSENILAPIGGALEAGAEAVAAPIRGEATPSELRGMAAAGTKEALLQAAGLLGVKGAPAAAAGIRELNIAKATALKEQQALDALRNKIRKEGQDIGLIAPAEGGAKLTLSKLGGAEPHLSFKNREVATTKIAEDVGLKKGAISDTDISTRVNQLSDDYGIVEKALGKSVGITDSFKAEVNKLLVPMKERIAQDPKAFAGYADAIDLLEQQLKQADIPPQIMMDKIKKLRNDARAYDKNPTGKPIEKDLAEASYKLANIYEDLIEGSLGGKKAILEKFRDSRKKLAQIHILDSARMADGLLDLQKLSSIVGKYGADKKMVTGNIKTVSDFANTFKSVTKPIEKSGFATPSRWETMMAIGAIPAAGATGSAIPLIAGAPMLARTVVPPMAELGMLQARTPSYGLSAARRAAPYAAGAGLLSAGFSPYIEEQQ